jgi:hypothetical protein
MYFILPKTSFTIISSSVYILFYKFMFIWYDIYIIIKHNSEEIWGNISIIDFRQIFDVFCDHRTLCMLEVSQCLFNSDHNQLTQEIKALELINPSLKVVHENQ